MARLMASKGNPQLFGETEFLLRDAVHRLVTDLKNRGVNDIFIVCVDGLSGFPEAIQTAFRQARVHLGIVHLVRAAMRYTTDKDGRAVARDLQKIDTAATVSEAERELKQFAATWTRNIRRYRVQRAVA